MKRTAVSRERQASVDFNGEDPHERADVFPIH
jgi:hypothetical protein